MTLPPRSAGSVLGPASVACKSCPYRRDVPSGLWHESEYQKLESYDADTMGQPLAIFLCHQQNGRVCSGWAGCHDMDQSLALWFAAIEGRVTAEVFAEIVDYRSPVPLFTSGAEAAGHGRAGIDRPDQRAQRAIRVLQRRQERRDG